MSGLAVTVGGLVALGLAVANLDAGPVAILVGALGLNASIVGGWLSARKHAGRLRRFIPPWLPW